MSSKSNDSAAKGPVPAAKVCPVVASLLSFDSLVGVTTPEFESVRHALLADLTDAVLVYSVAISASGTVNAALLIRHLTLLHELGVGLTSPDWIQCGPNGYVLTGSVQSGIRLALHGITAASVRPLYSVTVLNSRGIVEYTLADPSDDTAGNFRATKPVIQGGGCTDGHEQGLRVELSSAVPKFGSMPLIPQPEGLVCLCPGASADDEVAGEHDVSWG